MAKSKEIKNEEAIKEDLVLSNTTIPAHLQKFANMGSVGFENLQKEDMIMPRLAIAQAISPQVQKGDPLLIEGLEVGQFFNTITEEIYGEKIVVSPLFFFPSRIFFPPRGSSDPERCRTMQLDENGKLIGGQITPEGCEGCPHSEFLKTPRPDGSNNPDCTYFMNYVCVIHKGNSVFEPIAFSAKSKMLRPTKKWNSKIRVRQLPGFCLMFELSTVPEKAKRGTFFNIKFSEAKNVTEDDILKTQAFYEEWSKRPINIDQKGADVEESESDNEVPF